MCFFVKRGLGCFFEVPAMFFIQSESLPFVCAGRSCIELMVLTFESAVLPFVLKLSSVICTTWVVEGGPSQSKYSHVIHVSAMCISCCGMETMHCASRQRVGMFGGCDIADMSLS